MTESLEAVWNADPLEAFGGFRNLTFDESITFTSPLTLNGSVSWRTFPAISNVNGASTSVRLEERASRIDSAHLCSEFGWSVFQYEIWARGHLEIGGESPRRLVLFTDNILELWVNDVHFFGGDFYGFRRAPIVVTIPAGRNRVDVRLIRDVRSVGGADFVMTVGLDAHVASGTVHILDDSVILPDLVDGKLPSVLGSVTVRNEAEEWIEVCEMDRTQVWFCFNLSTA